LERQHELAGTTGHLLEFPVAQRKDEPQRVIPMPRAGRFGDALGQHHQQLLNALNRERQRHWSTVGRVKDRIQLPSAAIWHVAS